MISQEEALEKILEAVRPLPKRRVILTEALNCFAAEDLRAIVPLFEAAFRQSATGTADARNLLIAKDSAGSHILAARNRSRVRRETHAAEPTVLDRV